jgi:F-type H+-transporting ATPase subunit b
MGAAAGRPGHREPAETHRRRHCRGRPSEAAYEKALAEARGRAQTIANETREKQAAAAEATRKKTEDELNARLAEAETSIAATKRAAMANVRAVAEDATAAIVERLIGLAPDQKTVAKAVADVLKG